MRQNLPRLLWYLPYHLRWGPLCAWRALGACFLSKDIRILLSFPNHRKTRRLNREIPGGTDYLIRLWCYAAEHRPLGYLTDMDHYDIAEEAGYTKDADHFVNTLIGLKWIDNTRKGLYLHDWDIHQPYVVKSPERSAQAKRAAEIKWGKRNGKQGDTCGQHKSAKPETKKSNPPSPFPSPSPSPSPKNKELLSEAYRLTDLLISKIIEHLPNYRELRKEKKEKTRQRWAEDINKAIRLDNRHPEELRDLIIWCQEDGFWKGNILSGSKLRQQYDKLVASKSRTDDNSSGGKFL